MDPRPPRPVQFSLPPAHPPPLLTPTQLTHLLTHGHLSLSTIFPPSLHTLLTALLAASLRFFARPSAQKHSFYPPAPATGTEHGYHFLPREKEFLTLRHLPAAVALTAAAEHAAEAQQELAELEDLAASVWRRVSALLLRVLADVSAALGIPFADAWPPLLPAGPEAPRGLDADEPTLLRLFRYFPSSASPISATATADDDDDRNGGGAGPHTDNGLLTLCFSDAPGLQVYSAPAAAASAHAASLSPATGGPSNGGNGGSSGVWTDAGPGATILIGDVLRVLSSGRARAGIHRVRVRGCASAVGRASVVFAMRPCLRGGGRRGSWDGEAGLEGDGRRRGEAEEDALPLGPFGGSGSVRVRALWQAITHRKVNVNAGWKVRDAQRARRRGEGSAPRGLEEQERGEQRPLGETA